VGYKVSGEVGKKPNFLIEQQRDERESSTSGEDRVPPWHVNQH